MSDKSYLDGLTEEEFTETFEAWNRSAIEDHDRVAKEEEERKAKKRELSRIIDPNGYMLPLVMKYAEDGKKECPERHPSICPLKNVDDWDD